MAPIDIKALTATASNAAENLPGEWRIDTDEGKPSEVAFLDHHAGEERWVGFAHCSGGCLEWIAASEHIAAFDPPTALRLLAQRGALLSALHTAEAFIAGFEGDGPEIDAWLAEVRAAIAAAEA